MGVRRSGYRRVVLGGGVRAEGSAHDLGRGCGAGRAQTERSCGGSGALELGAYRCRLGVLLARASEVVAEGQQTLDFEVSTRVQALTDVADYREAALMKVSAAGSEGRAGGAHDCDQFASAVRGVGRGLRLAGFSTGSSMMRCSGIW